MLLGVKNKKNKKILWSIFLHVSQSDIWKFLLLCYKQSKCIKEGKKREKYEISTYEMQEPENYGIYSVWLLLY